MSQKMLFQLEHFICNADNRTGFSPLGEVASLQASLLSQEPVFKRARDFIDIADASLNPDICDDGDNAADKMEKMEFY